MLNRSSVPSSCTDNKQIFTIVFHCVPVQGYWDVHVKAQCHINDRTFFVSTVLPHLIIDVGIISLPIPFLGKLQMGKWQKTGLICTFALAGL